MAVSNLCLYRYLYSVKLPSVLDKYINYMSIISRAEKSENRKWSRETYSLCAEYKELQQGNDTMLHPCLVISCRSVSSLSCHVSP